MNTHSSQIDRVVGRERRWTSAGATLVPGVLSARTLIPSTILLVPWDTTARSAATQNLRNLRMTKRDVLLLKSAPRAEQSLVTTMPANRTQSYGGSGTPAAWTTRKLTRLRHRPKLGSAPHVANLTLACQ